MGSGLTQCFASRQSIQEKEPIVIIPIIELESYRTLSLVSSRNQEFTLPRKEWIKVDSSSFFCPVGPVIFAKGDDYGRCSIKKGAENTKNFYNILLYLKKNSLVTKAGENPYHDKEYDFEKLMTKHTIDLSSLEAFQNSQNIGAMWEELSEMIQKNRVFVTSLMGSPVMFSYSVCLKRVYNKVLGYKNFKEAELLEKLDEEQTLPMMINSLNDPEKRSNALLLDLISRLFECNMERRIYLSSFHRLEIAQKVVALSLTKVITKEDIIQTIKTDMRSITEFLTFCENLSYRYCIPYLPVWGYDQDYSNSKGKNNRDLLVSSFKEKKWD